jgi:hypothetical protein
MSGIFGGKKSSQQSRSENVNNSLITNTLAPQMQQGVNATGQAASFLDGDASQFNRYKAATGFDAFAEDGARGIMGSGAARGLLRSGASGKALQQFGQNQQNTWAQGFIQNLLGMGQQGNAAASNIANAGQVSTSSGQSREKPGIGGFLGQVASGFAASDERLKKNVVKLGTTPEGLGLYQFRYLDDSGPFIGVMAQEVKEKKPEALGPVIDGYMTVNYNRLTLGVV